MNVHSVPQTPSDSLSTSHSAQVPSQMLNSDYRELLIHHNFFFLVNSTVLTYPLSEFLMHHGEPAELHIELGVKYHPSSWHRRPSMLFFLSTVTALSGWAIQTWTPSSQCFRFTHPLVPLHMTFSLS